MSVVETPWDVRIVSLASSAMTTVAYIPEWESIDFVDTVNDFGHGTINFDKDAQWLSDFYTANSNKYPWEGNFGVQVYRSGTLVYTFICEEAEIQYVGTRRQVSLGGRGLAACLTWGVLLPEGYDEAQSDPDDPDNVLFMTRGFGNVGSQADIDAGNYSVDSPQYKAYGGAAFKVLFDEANTGETQTWVNYMVGSANRVDSLGNNGKVTWPLSLSSNLSTTKDSNNVNWSATATYPEADVTWLFELKAGIDMFDVLTECCTLTANAQYNVKPNGEIHIAKLVGTDRSATILLSVPQSTSNINSLRSTDARSYVYSSNGYLFEAQSDSTSLARFGRREGFIDADQSDGNTVTEIARRHLDETSEELDEFTFSYIETETTRALLDFFVGDTVSIEYEPGKKAARQITGVGFNITPQSVGVDVVIGDIVKNSIASLAETVNHQQALPGLTVLGKNIPAPTITGTTVLREGNSRSVKIDFKTPGWVGSEEDARYANLIGHFEAEVYSVDTSQGDLNTTLVDEVKYRAIKAIDTTGVAQSIVVPGMGQKGANYVARVRAIGGKKGLPISAYATTSSFALTQSGEGSGSDPYTPGAPSSLAVVPMLNSALVSFSDFTASSNPTVAGNRGSYEIQVSNATTGSFSDSGNTFSRTIGGNATSLVSGGAPRKFRVPDGTGYVCTGLLSVSGGRTHYFKVRAINNDGTAGAFSSVVSVSLDIDDESQTGIIIGEDSITANAIKAGSITATEISAGSITADRMNADQVITSAIRMPQPSGAGNAGVLADGSVGNEIKFSVDKDGNMWWGNFASYANASSNPRVPVSGTASNDYVASRFKGDGSEFFIGTPNNYVGFHGNTAKSKSLIVDGSATVVGTLNVSSGSVTAGNTSLSSTRLQFGTGPFLSIDHALGTYFGGNSIAIKWGGTSGSDAYGYIAGGNFGFGSAMIAMGMSTSSYHYSSAVQSGIYASGSANIHIHSASRFMKIEASGSTSYIQLTADDGIYINDITPTNTGYRMYNIGGTLHFNGSALGGSMDIAGLTTATPGNPALTFIPWAYSTTGSERKMTVATLAQELLSTGEFVDPDGSNSLAGHLTMSNGTSSTIRGNGNLFLMRSSATYAMRFIAGANEHYATTVGPRYAYGANLGSSSKPFSTVYRISESTGSDEKIKTDVADETKGVDFLKTLRPRTYKFTTTLDEDSGDMRAGVRTHHGFIAQEMRTALGDDATNDGLWYRQVIPAVEETTDETGKVTPAADETDFQGIRYTELISPIVKAIQELSARVEALEG